MLASCIIKIYKIAIITINFIASSFLNIVALSVTP